MDHSMEGDMSKHDITALCQTTDYLSMSGDIQTICGQKQTLQQNGLHFVPHPGPEMNKNINTEFTYLYTKSFSEHMYHYDFLL